MNSRDEDGQGLPLQGEGRDLTVGSIPRHLVAFSLPMLAGSALQLAYNLINAVWVGRFLGPDALAAATVSQPIAFVLISVAAGMTLATNILVAQAVGARAWERLCWVVDTSYLLIGALSLVLLVASLLNADHLLRLMGAPPVIFAQAARYLRVYLWTLPFTFGIFLIGSMLRGLGNSRTPVYFQTLGVVINTILDPLLIFGLLGLPRMGLVGAATASVIAQAISVAALVIYVSVKRHLVTPDVRRLGLHLPTAWHLLRIGVPATVQQSVVSVSLFGLTRIVSGFGPLAVAALGVGLRIDGVAFLPAIVMGSAASTLSGQNIGACEYDRVRQVFRWGILLGGGITLIIALVAVIIPGLLARGFTRDPAVVAISSAYLRIGAATYVLYVVMFVCNGIVNGAGQTLVTTVIAILALWLVRLPVAGGLAHALHNVNGVWYGMLISVAAGTLLSLAYYATGWWKEPLLDLFRRSVLRRGRG